MKSIFTDKAATPTAQDLATALGAAAALWDAIRDYTLELFPEAVPEWKCPSERFGWGFRLSDKKRVLVYLLPRDGFFRVGLVFGQKATAAVLASGVTQAVKDELQAARAYAEGKGIRVEVRSPEALEDIRTLISIKLQY